MFKKKWWVVQTDMYFVSHTEEKRELIGPYRFKYQAERSALWNANRAIRSDKKLEFLVVRNGEQTHYGLDITADVAAYYAVSRSSGSSFWDDIFDIFD